jgi:hypothetical protein
MHGLAVLLGLMVGLVLWSILLLSLGGNPVGRTGGFDLLVILSPIIGLVLPVALNLLDAKRSVVGTWLLALAPLAGLLNVGICFFIASVTGIAPDAWSLPIILAILIWIVPAAMLFRKLGANAAERS